MLIDGSDLPAGTRIEAELCIIGGGPAGITLARELADWQLNVCLIESGATEEDPRVEALNQGENVGAYAIDMTSRLRFLGGASNHWGGNSAPLDPIDFEERPWVPNATWPIQFDELARFFPRVHDVCRLGPCDFEPEHWVARDPDFAEQLIDGSGNVITKVFQTSPLRFGRAFRNFLYQKRGG